MAALVSAIELREEFYIETDATNVALEEISIAESYAVNKISGSASERIEYFAVLPSTETITLSEKAASITTILENDTTLATTDYTFRANNMLIRKSVHWGKYVAVTYVPLDEQGLLARQRMVVVQLIKLWLAYNGYQAIGGPDINVTGQDYYTERKKILNTLIDDWVFV